MDVRELVRQHYGRNDLVDGVLEALRGAGTDVDHLAAPDLYPADRRGVPLGIVSGVQEIGSVLGPLLGAVVLTVSDWRAIFALNLAVALVLAAALRVGRHRTDRMPAGGEHALALHRSARALEDLRDAAVVLTAGFGGLRRGEHVGLQWHDIDFAHERLLVRRSFVLGELTSTKGRARTPR